MSIAYVFVFLLVVWLIYRAKKLGKFKEKGKPLPVNKTHAGRYIGDITAATDKEGKMLTWGGVNDEHSPADTAATLAARPDWRGLGYCPAGTFDFTVGADKIIRGFATIYGHRVNVLLNPYMHESNIEFFVDGHVVNLTFDNGKVTGRLWEGHDKLKRATVSGIRV